MSKRILFTISAIAALGLLATVAFISCGRNTGKDQRISTSSNLSAAGSKGSFQEVDEDPANVSQAAGDSLPIPSHSNMLPELPPSTFADWQPIILSGSGEGYAQLEDKDFSPYFDDLPNGLEVEGKVAEWFDKDHGKVSAVLSANEKRRLYGFQLPGTGMSKLPSIEFHYFHTKHGRMPANSLEMAREMDSAAFTPRWLNDLANESPANQFSAIARYLNPITGKFYRTFQAKDWEPGGIYLEALTNEPHPGDPNYNYVESQRKHNLPIPDSWLIRLWGDQPGEILLEQPVYFYCSQDWQKVKGNT
jgi:hypothetical protein